MFRINSIILVGLLFVSSCISSNGTPTRETTVPPVKDLPDNIDEIQTPTLSLAETFLIQDASFNLQNLDQILPSDIVQEIYFYGGLGGCGRFCRCFMEDNSTLAIYAEEGPVEVFESVGFEICGIKPDEIVSVTVELPDGKVNQFEQLGSEGIEYIPDLRDPPGEYHLTFSGNNWTLEKDIQVVDANGPRLYLTKDNKLIFYKFSPHEKVRLFAYQDGKLIGWKEFVVNDKGDLTVEANLVADFIAVGENSGQVYYREEGEWISWTAWLGSKTDIFCGDNTKASGIKPNGYAEVLADSLPNYKLNLDGNWSQVGEFAPGKGTLVQIKSNATCLDDGFYWYLECIDNSCSGFVPEAGPNGSYLKPIENLPPTATPDPAAIPTCPGTLPTRLSIGMKAEVTTSGMAPQLSLRVQPSLSAEKVHVIAAGRDMVILKGPICADNSYWWFIRSEQGFEGWSREGDNEDYWIDPLP